MKIERNKQLQHFMQNSGFKVLAMARLSDCEYSVVLYLVNTALSDLEYFITTEAELASLIGYSEQTLRDTLVKLSEKNIIRLQYADHGKGDLGSQSLRVGLQYELKEWQLGFEEDADTHDAIVFPFRRQGAANLKLFDGDKKDSKYIRKDKGEIQTWERVLESFVRLRELTGEEHHQAEEAAKILVQTHPVDQVLLMIRHFGHRIPTLSLLASSWQHYQEVFEDETQKVDLLEARQKHLEQDAKIREQALLLLEKKDEHELSQEEINVLQILSRHRHPRRQLFWAYQLRSRYPKLGGFFSDNIGLMLAVTTGGTVVKKGPDQL